MSTRPKRKKREKREREDEEEEEGGEGESSSRLRLTLRASSYEDSGGEAKMAEASFLSIHEMLATAKHQRPSKWFSV
jgi:hypothetical protein